MVLQLNENTKAMMLKALQEEKRRQLEERRRQFFAAQNSRKSEVERALSKSFRDIGDGIVSLVTSPNSVADKIKKQRDAYRYNKIQMQKLMALRNSYRLLRTGAASNGRVYAGVPKLPNRTSYRTGHQNTPQQRMRVSPAMVRFLMMGRDAR